MLLAQGRFWRIEQSRAADAVQLGLLRESLGDDLRELRDFRLEVPLDKWNRVVKHARSDRKLLGGVVLDYAKQKDQLATVLGNDRLYSELQRMLLEASVSLIESGVLVLTAVDIAGD